MSPVKGSDLAKQIELARQEIESWPEWLKVATGITGKEPGESSSEQKSSGGRLKMSDADFID